MYHTVLQIDTLMYKHTQQIRMYFKIHDTCIFSQLFRFFLYNTVEGYAKHPKYM